MKLKYTLIWLCMIATGTTAWGQSFLRGAYVRSVVEFENTDMVLYDFSRARTRGRVVKAKYFAKDANHQFEEWQNGKQILFYCSGAFSESWDTDSPPLGICVDNGRIVNRNLDQRMDGLIIVYNGGAQEGGIAVVNIDEESVHVSQGGDAEYDLRDTEDRLMFLRWASQQGATVFQTQLMYTKSHGYGFPQHNLTYGDEAERRFLAICMKDGVVHHIVIDHPESDYLNRASDKVVRYLKDQMGYQIFGLFNLDTGGKNIMRAYNEDGNELSRGPKAANEATNLLVYYVD